MALSDPLPTTSPPPPAGEYRVPPRRTEAEVQATEAAQRKQADKANGKAFRREVRGQFVARAIGLSPFAYTLGVQGPMMFTAYLYAGNMADEALSEVFRLMRGGVFSDNRQAKRRFEAQQRKNDELIRAVAMREAHVVLLDKKWRENRVRVNPELPDLSRDLATGVRSAVSGMYVQGQALDEKQALDKKNNAKAEPIWDAVRLSKMMTDLHEALGDRAPAILGFNPDVFFGPKGRLANSSEALLLLETVANTLETDPTDNRRVVAVGIAGMSSAVALGRLWRLAGVQPKEVFAASVMNDIGKEAYFCEPDEALGLEWNARAARVQKMLDVQFAPEQVVRPSGNQLGLS